MVLYNWGQVKLYVMSEQTTSPGNKSGYTDEEINEMAQEAVHNGEMQQVDILGNASDYEDDKFDDILVETINGEERDLPVERVLACVRHLQGRILTIVDATMVDKERAKYVKDLMKDAFSTKANWIYEMSIRDFENL